MTAPLRPLATIAELLPPRTALATRTRLDQVAWIGMQPEGLDSLTGAVLAFAGTMPTHAHRAALTPTARALLARAGLALPCDLPAYEAEADARRQIQDWAARGYRIASIYPLPADWLPAEAHLVPPALLRRLNNKAHLADYVPAAFLPERQCFAPQELDRAESCFAGAPVILKVGTDNANGAGNDVAFGRDAPERRAAIAALVQDPRPFDSLIVERLYELESIWCAGFAVLDHGVRWLGASLHRLNGNGLQGGNILGSGPAIPDSLRAAIEAIAAKAGAEGFRGIAGCDAAVTRAGRQLIFDLNFRLNASTALLLFYPAAAARGGRTTAIACQMKSVLPAEELAARVTDLVEEGSLVPTRLLDYRLLPRPSLQSSVTGLLLAQDEAAVLALEAELQTRLGLA